MKQALRESNTAQVHHYLARVQEIRRGVWRPYPGSFGAFLVHVDDEEFTKPERLRRMRAVLERAIESSMSDAWIEIVDLPDNQVTGDCRRWYCLTWAEMP